MKIALILLVKNELPCLEIVFPEIPRPGREVGYDSIIAVDGGSTDGTCEFLSGHGIEIVTQNRPGRGEAFLEVFRLIEADAFIFFSPDGNESIQDLPKFKTLLESGADIVIASRMMKGAYNEEDDIVFRWRKWANKTFNLLANASFRRTGPYVTDSINGFRAITRAAAAQLRLDASDYTIEYQMTIRALKHGMRIVEFPTIEGSRVAGETGAPSIPTGLRFIDRFFKELFDRPSSVRPETVRHRSDTGRG